METLGADLETMRRVPLAPEHVDAICAIGGEKFYPAGSIVMDIGEAMDRFVYVIEGTATLVTNAGKMLVPSGHCAGFPAGQADGHCLINETDKDVVYLEIGDRAPGDVVAYPDDDLAAKGTSGWAMTRKNGSPL